MELYAELLRKLDEYLHAGTYGNDIRRAAEVGLDLCYLVESELDQEQLGALDAAREYWRGAGSEAERLRYVHSIAEKIRRCHTNIASSERSHVLDRLLFCALNTNTRLTVTAAEFMVELAEALRLPAKDVSNVFSRHIPNFESNLP
jgi:hypothetical protein